jgi:hypothetical protein
MKAMRHLLPIVALGLLAACATPPHYQWGGYEQSLYSYYKSPAKADQYTLKLAEAVRRGEEQGHVAPGLHAEYGYMLMNSGRKAEAIAEFESEKQRWPDSTLLMDRMIRLANDQDGGPAKSAAAGGKARDKDAVPVPASVSTKTN